MKTLRFIGMALFAILMSVNFASCSSGDDDPTEEKEEGGVEVSGKKLAKIVGKQESSTNTMTYAFSYDSEGRLTKATESYESGNEKEVDTFQFIWGDDIIKVIEDENTSNSYNFTLKNGLIKSCDDGKTFTYNNSNKFIRGESKYDTTTAIWDGEKLKSISNEYDKWDVTFTYGESCKKGYFPFIPTRIGFSCEILFMAHPEIVGMQTTQLPATLKETSSHGSEECSITYEFDKEGYISKITMKDENANQYTYTLTWQ